MSDKNIVELM